MRSGSCVSQTAIWQSEILTAGGFGFYVALPWCVPASCPPYEGAPPPVPLDVLLEYEVAFRYQRIKLVILQGVLTMLACPATIACPSSDNNTPNAVRCERCPDFEFGRHNRSSPPGAWAHPTGL